MITVENLVKSFKTTRVLQGIDHTQRKGEAVVLIGPSGCGKSTFLRCLNHVRDGGLDSFHNFGRSNFFDNLLGFR